MPTPTPITQNIAAAIINTLPQIGQTVPIFFTVIDNVANHGELFAGAITSITLLYGNAILDNSAFTFIANDNNPISIQVNATYSSVNYVSILYTKAVSYNILPNNFQRIVQKIPKGIFTDFNPSNTIIGADLNARAKMIDDYYSDYFNVVNEVYSNAYSPQLEYEYNGTVGLLSSGTSDIISLFRLLGSASSYSLTVYSIELFLSKYINYRLGLISAVYIGDNLYNPTDYWLLGDQVLSVLGVTTRLAPAGFGQISDFVYNFYNASSFTDSFKQELSNLIQRMGRADIGFQVIYFDDIHPPSLHFTYEYGTYPTDPRLAYGRCIEFQGNSAFPLDIYGYTNKAAQPT